MYRLGRLPVNAIIETTTYKPQLWKRRNANYGDLRRARNRNDQNGRINRIIQPSIEEVQATILISE